MIGDLDHPIPRDVFRSVFLPDLLVGKNHYYKCTPTLVLYPSDTDDPPSSTVATVLKRKNGQTVEEVVRDSKGKAILLNFCTDSMEAYTKKMEGCAAIYDMEQVDSAIVPEEETVLHRYVQDAAPLRVNSSIDYAAVTHIMRDLKTTLGRTAPWRIAFNKTDSVVTAFQLTSPVMESLFRTVGRSKTSTPEGVYYREESFTPTYAFAVDDWVLLDREAKTMVPKTDKEGVELVRTVHGPSFETTYRLVQ
jgi:hypothetical protein